MDNRREIISQTQNQSRHSCDYGYLWRINHVSAAYEIVNVFLETYQNVVRKEDEFFDCWIVPYHGKVIHYKKKDVTKLEIYSSPDEALYQLFKEEIFKSNEYDFDRIKKEVESFHNYDGKRVSFMLTPIEFAKLYVRTYSVDQLSDYLENKCMNAISLFEF